MSKENENEFKLNITQDKLVDILMHAATRDDIAKLAATTRDDIAKLEIAMRVDLAKVDVEVLLKDNEKIFGKVDLKTLDAKQLIELRVEVVARQVTVIVVKKCARFAKLPMNEIFFCAWHPPKVGR